MRKIGNDAKAELPKLSAPLPKLPVATSASVAFLSGRQNGGSPMSVLSYGIVLNAALYGLLAYAATFASIIEKRAGHEKLCRHHQIAAFLYALLGIAQALHN